MRRTIGRLLLLSFGVSALCSCSQFDSQWNALASQNHPAAGIEGRWQGTWVSDASGHSGDLLAAIRNTGGGHNVAAFSATYGGIFHFAYDTPMVDRQRDGETFFEGQEDLSFLAGGVYRYDGHASTNQLFCTYRSKYDYGHFSLRRVTPPPAARPAQPTSAP
jgi:hypothetical protein